MINHLPVPTPFLVGPVNVYLLDGEPLTLVDCGPKTDEALDALKTGLAELGYQLSDIEQLIITHHHSDHLGLTAQVVEASQATVIAHPQCVPYLENPLATRQHNRAFFERLCYEANVPEDVIAAQEKSFKYVAQFTSDPVKVDQVIDEGNEIQAGSITWHVYHTPGHAGDLICLYDDAERVLLASDHIILKISSNPIIEPPRIHGEPRPRRLIEYIHHLKRMAELDVQIALSGHGKPIEDIGGLVEKRAAFHQERAQQILSYFNGQPRNLWDITQEMFSHVAITEQFLAISEVLGHIDLLEAEGKLQRTRNQDVVHWQTPA